jgi:hypothetical protein
MDTLPSNIDLSREYEERRWLADEPIVYIGQTDQTIRKRLKDFYRHKCGNPGPHAGGQVIKLLRCALWVYWSHADNPYNVEQTMICAFKAKVGQVPYANYDGAKEKRVRRLG